MKSTKLFVGYSVFVSFAFLVAIFITAFLILPIKDIGVTGSAIDIPQSASGLPALSLKLTPEEISKHNSTSDCWVILNNKVYDLSPFLSIYSGGSEAIIPYCGKDGTNAYNSKDKNPAKSHNNGDLEALKKYYLGDLNQIIIIRNPVLANQTSNQVQNISSESNTDIDKNQDEKNKTQMIESPLKVKNESEKKSSESNSKKLALSEVAKHNSASDCWVIVSNKIYDLTSFLSSHSGGSEAIIPYCGKDGTVAYQTKDKDPAKSHSSGDITILSQYYIGDLKNTEIDNQNNNPTTDQNSGGSTINDSNNGDSENVNNNNNNNNSISENINSDTKSENESDKESESEDKKVEVNDDLEDSESEDNKVEIHNQEKETEDNEEDD